MKEMYRKSPSLMELVVRPENIEKAIKKVKKNKGAPGIEVLCQRRLVRR
ncbi:hypothetical protein O0511_002361 [Staphylococcus pseudintermedius]|nr:hypothetical protein [Staphylococcus pseudintermedius]